MIAAAHATGLAVAVHIEPYAGRTVESTVARRGLPALATACARSTSTGRSTCRSPTGRRRRRRCMPGRLDAVRADGARRCAAAAGFDGVYTYDIVTYGGDKFAPAVRARRTRVNLLCAPSVGPGYNARRGSGDPVREAAPQRRDLRRDVARGDRGEGRPRHDHVVQRMARGDADRAGRAADAGTARYATCRTTGPGGCTACRPSARTSTRTRYWSDVFRSTSPLQPKTRAS